MTDEQIIKACAELDGWRKHTIAKDDPYTCTVCNLSYSPLIWREWEPAYRWCPNDGVNHPPDYLTSYDAIIPLIQKQHGIIRDWIHSNHAYTTTPRQLCEALLRATGKWIE